MFTVDSLEALIVAATAHMLGDGEIICEIERARGRPGWWVRLAGAQGFGETLRAAIADCTRRLGEDLRKREAELADERTEVATRAAVLEAAAREATPGVPS